MAELARLFREETPKLLTSLRDAVTERDTRGIERYAHTLKGSVSYFSPTRAQQYAYALERIGREHDISCEHDINGVDELFRQLQEALAGCIRELEAAS